MSSKSNHTINLFNYEEWFVLYMDNEICAQEKATVDAFLLLHPHLQEELDILLSTKLPADDVLFFGKENLKAEAMKLNAVDESLLLYIDNELSAAEQKAVEERLSADKDFKRQYEILLQTKADACEVIPYPNKKELYRHTERVVVFPVWMRIAVAVILILFASLFVVFKQSNKPVGSGYVIKINKPAQQKLAAPPTNVVPQPAPLPQQLAVVKTETRNKTTVKVKMKNAIVSPAQKALHQQPALGEQEQRAALAKVEPIKIDEKKFTDQPTIPLNNLVATTVVTTVAPTSYKKEQRNPEVTAGTDGEFRTKRTPAKGFLRKVSRFIERRTGIGTVNADNELLVGAVALKLN